MTSELETRRRVQTARALELVVALELVDDRIVKVRLESNDSWLLVDLWTRDPTFPPEMTEPQRFAIWLETLAMFRVGDDGAVEEEPIVPSEALR